MLRSFSLVLGAAATLSLVPSFSASAEPREQYLARLAEVCEVDCLQPRQFRRTARKRVSNDQSDMAIIMDVLAVRRVGSKFELLSLDLERAPLEELEILGSAGINTSGRNGIGGLPRGSQGGTHPNLIIIEMDKQTLFDVLNLPSPADEAPVVGSGDKGDIVVDGEQTDELAMPKLATLRSFFRNRRVVVRGKPRLQPVLIGARRDFRQKQVTLELSDAARLVMLPRYDDDGNPILEGDHSGLAQTPVSLEE